jgi:hypothetical protein
MVKSIKVRDVADRADTAEQGALLYKALMETLKRPGQVTSTSMD